MPASRRLLLATVSLLAFTSGAAAQNWTGFYVGLNAGGAWNGAEFTSLGDQGGNTIFGVPNGSPFWSPSVGGFTGGGQVGFNWQMANLVYGLEGDVNWSNAKSTASLFAGNVTAQTNLNTLVTVRGRVGFTTSPMVLVYATGGLAIARIRDSWGAPASPDDFVSNGTRTGWIVGGGIEYMFLANWTVRLEGLYGDLGARSVDGRPTCTGNYRSRFDHTVALLRGGFNFKW